MESLGKEIVQQRTRCATLSLDTLRAAIRKREREQMISKQPLMATETLENSRIDSQ